MKNIAIFASGAGTKARNIIKYFSKNEKIKVSLVISNNSKAGVHEEAMKLRVPSITFTKNDFSSGFPVLNLLNEYQIDFIVLAGFMCKIADTILKVYPNKIVNIHPALLPKYGGKGMYEKHVHEAVVAAHEKEIGITIHYINENYDEGDIIFQTSCKISDSDTPDIVASKVHALEYKYYPIVIEKILTQEV